MKRVLIFIVVLVLILFVLALLFPKRQNTKPDFKKVVKVANGSCKKVAGGSCSKSCGAIDPVNDPDYNVRETIKQTLLLEQHLAEKAKYCKSCCVKHFLLIEAYLVEGVWMAGNHCKDYPKLEESVDFFKKLFDKWHKNMDDKQIILDTLTQLRIWRRDMVDLYYFAGKQSDSHS
jgi:uncharacterized protein YxeA